MSLFYTIKKFRNAHWFKDHLYAYKNLWNRKKLIKKGVKFLYNAELFFDARCNFKCEHCSISSYQKQSSSKVYMNLEEITRVADELKNLKCFLCCLVGGEPTLRKDLLDIISIFHKREILPTIITNGYLIDENYVKEMKKAGLFNIGISFNGATPESHDIFVKKEGAFEKALAIIEYAQKLKICTSIAVVPTHENIANGEYRKLIEFSGKKNIRVNVNYPALAGEFTNQYDALLTEEELKEVREYFKLPNVSSDFTVLADKYECPAGRKKIYILPDGNVCTCTFIFISFGNILEEPLQKIMERIWSTKIFMSRPGCCLVGESTAFIKKYLEPVFKSEKVPLYYKDHPLFK